MYLGIQLSVSPTKLPSLSLFTVEQCLKETHTMQLLKFLTFKSSKLHTVPHKLSSSII